VTRQRNCSACGQPPPAWWRAVKERDHMVSIAKQQYSLLQRVTAAGTHPELALEIETTATLLANYLGATRRRPTQEATAA
jgi:hypothetical protein